MSKELLVLLEKTIKKMTVAELDNVIEEVKKAMKIVRKERIHKLIKQSCEQAKSN